MRIERLLDSWKEIGSRCEEADASDSHLSNWFVMD